MARTAPRKYRPCRRRTQHCCRGGAYRRTRRGFPLRQSRHHRHAARRSSAVSRQLASRAEGRQEGDLYRSVKGLAGDGVSGLATAPLRPAGAHPALPRAIWPPRRLEPVPGLRQGMRKNPARAFFPFKVDPPAARRTKGQGFGEVECPPYAVMISRWHNFIMAWLFMPCPAKA